MALTFIDQGEPVVQPFDTSKLEQDLGEVAGPWAGRPGQFADKGRLQNGLDAINKAGASPLGFAKGNRNDIELVRKFYSQNPQVANQYDLPVNMFLRYISGVGDKGLAVGNEQGKRMLASIQAAKERLGDPNQQSAWLNSLSKEYRESYSKRVASGAVPVDYPDIKGGPSGELGFSLGRFWAEPQKNGSYKIVEDFDFANGGKGRKGSLSAAGVANGLVGQGHGSPFKYTLIVQPDGTVRAIPRSLEIRQGR